VARQLMPLALVAALFTGCQVDQDVSVMSEDAFVPSHEVKGAVADFSPPPPYDLTLDVNNLAIDDFVQMTVSGANPGDNVIFLRGTGLGETCPPGFAPLCVDLANPSLAYIGSTDTADADGIAERYFLLPANPDLVGRRVYMQAVVMSPEIMLSNVVESEVSAGLDCDDDLFEPNDAVEEAIAIPGGNWENLSMCSDLEDWYAIDVLEGDIIDWDIAFLDAEGDIDINLYNSAGDLLAASVSVGDSESIDYLVEADDTLFFRVYMFRDEGIEQQGNIYDMSIDRTPGELTFCLPDGFEDNDTPGTAFDLSGAGLISGGGVTDEFNGLTSCEGDGPSNYDVYGVDVVAGENITVFLEFADAEGDVDIALLDLGGATLDSSLSTSDNEFVNYTSDIDQTILVRVELFSDEGVEIINGNNYDMNVTVGVGATLDALLQGSDYGAHEGQMMSAALVDIATGLAVASDSQFVLGGEIFFPFADAMDPEGSYEWHLWADMNGSGVCDAPPTDHTWLIEAGQAFDNIVTTYNHDVDFTDVCATF
jgi:hypothetical protein